MKPSPLVDADFRLPYPFASEPPAPPATPTEPPRRRLSHGELVRRAEAKLDRMLAAPDVGNDFRLQVALVRRRGCTLARHKRFGWVELPVDSDAEHIARAAELVASKRQEEHRESEEVDLKGTGYFED